MKIIQLPALVVLLAAACIPPGQQTTPSPSWSNGNTGGAGAGDYDDDRDGDGGADDDGGMDDDDGGTDDDDGGTDDDDGGTSEGNQGRGGAGGGGQWSCRAAGAYETCASTGLCTTWPVTGMGLGSSESQAQIQAETNCSGHMTNLMASANLGDSSASVKTSCTVSSCDP